jgi:hypothetical protein
MLTLTTNSNTDLKVTSGRRYTVSVSGSFDSGTLALQWKQGTDFVAFRDSAGPVSFTSAGAVEVVTPSPDMRLALSGVAAAASINVVVQPIKA